MVCHHLYSLCIIFSFIKGLHFYFTVILPTLCFVIVLALYAESPSWTIITIACENSDAEVPDSRLLYDKALQ